MTAAEFSELSNSILSGLGAAAGGVASIWQTAQNQQNARLNGGTTTTATAIQSTSNNNSMLLIGGLGLCAVLLFLALKN